MKLFLDTEFNGFNGQLIALALVPDAGLDPFYEVLDTTDMNIDPWVQENVIPHLNRTAITKRELRIKLAGYLREIGKAGPITIVADYPVDFVHLMQLIETGPGVCMDIPNLNFELVFDLDTTPHHTGTKHNALDDADALRRAYSAKK